MGDKQPKNDDTKESDSKQKCSHSGALKDYFAAIDAIVNAMSKNQQKTGEDENSVENGNSTPEKTADEEQNNNNFGEEKQPMKDFLNVMDTIVGKLMTHHHNENSISSEEKNLCQTEVVVDKLSPGGNADDNNADQTIKIKTPTE